MNLKTRLAASRGVCTALHLRRREPECRAMPPQASPSKRGRSQRCVRARGGEARVPGFSPRPRASKRRRPGLLLRARSKKLRARGHRTPRAGLFAASTVKFAPPPGEKARRTGLVNSAREVPRSAVGQNFINDRASSPARGARSPAAGAKSPAAGAESPVGRVPWSSDAERGPRVRSLWHHVQAPQYHVVCESLVAGTDTPSVRRRRWADPDPLGRGASAGKRPRVPSKGHSDSGFSRSTGSDCFRPGRDLRHGAEDRQQSIGFDFLLRP